MIGIGNASPKNVITDRSVAGGGKSNVWIVLCLCMVAAFYFVWLNRVLYQVQSPFFDSLSYFEKLHRVMSLTRSEGMLAGFSETLNGSNTVFLPFLISIPLAYFIEPCREIGIGIQIVELFFVLWSADIYMRRVAKSNRESRLAVEVAFLGLGCLYYQNGGISDFRMDLSLMLFYATSSLWLLTAISDWRISSFFTFGVAMGIACLFRATAPVYFVIAFTPIVVITFVRSWTDRSRTMQLFLGLSLAGFSTLVISGWYYALNYSYLHHYYVVWNTDANANLPWLESLGHLKLAVRGAGNPVIALAIILSIVLIGRRRLVKQPGRNSPRPSIANHFRGIDWRWGWIAIAPLAILIIRRAGLNPFVSMPTIAGAFFLIAFWHQELFRTATLGQRRTAWALILLCVVGAGTRGWLKHSFTKNGSMASHRLIIDLIAEDAAKSGLRQIRFGTLQTTELCTSSLWSTVLFDRPDTQHEQMQIRINGIQFMPSRTFFHPAVSDWKSIRGSNDEERRSELIRIAQKEDDYLVMPSRQTLPFITEEVSQPVINHHLAPLKDTLLASGNWVKISGEIEVMPGRTYEVYRRNHGQMADRKPKTQIGQIR